MGGNGGDFWWRLRRITETAMKHRTPTVVMMMIKVLMGPSCRGNGALDELAVPPWGSSVLTVCADVGAILKELSGRGGSL